MAEKANPVIEKLFNAGAHFGYNKSRRNPSTGRYLFGIKGGVELFDLEQTAAALERACAFLKEQGARRASVLFVGSKAEARTSVERAAKRLGQPYVAGRWIGGTLTNWSEISKRLARLGELSDMRDKGETSKFTKLERLLIDREIDELDRMFGGLRGLERPPQVLIVVDPRQEKTAVAEARAMRIPVVALLNSDCNAKEISYPVPGNDASRHTIEFILGEFARALEQGRLAAAPVEPAKE